MLRYILLLIYLAIALCPLGCTPANNESVIILGTSVDYPPFEFRQNSEIQGFEIDIARSFAESLGKKLEIQDIDFSGLIVALNSDRVDFVMSALYATEERAKNVDFSDVYYHNNLALLSKQQRNIKTISDLSNKTLGVQLGSVFEQIANEHNKQIKTMKIVAIARVNQLVEDLKIGRIDAILLEEDLAKSFSTVVPELSYTLIDEKFDSGYSAAFKKSAALRTEFNKFIAEYKKSGKLDELHNKWFKGNK
jgi:ABC-type amino acid transport substrate-binding protein